MHCDHTAPPAACLCSLSQWEAVTEAAKSMITEMLVVEEAQRSTAAELLKVGSVLRLV